MSATHWRPGSYAPRQPPICGEHTCSELQPRWSWPPSRWLLGAKLVLTRASENRGAARCLPSVRTFGPVWKHRRLVTPLSPLISLKPARVHSALLKAPSLPSARREAGTPTITITIALLYDSRDFRHVLSLFRSCIWRKGTKERTCTSRPLGESLHPANSVGSCALCQLASVRLALEMSGQTRSCLKRGLLSSHQNCSPHLSL